MRKKLGATIALASVFGLALVGCGGGDDSTTATSLTGATSTAATSTAATTTGGKALAIAMGDDFFDPKDASAAAGSVTITAQNNGQLVHELVLAKTDTDPSQLPTTSDGEVDEAALESKGEDAGEIADVAPGASKGGDFKLSPGTYVMFCNIPGHYAAGMYGTLTVK